MHLRNSLALLLTASAMTPLMVTSAEAYSKVIQTSYHRVSPTCVKETKIIKSTRLISKGTCSKRTVHRVAYSAPRTHSYTTTTRTTSMFIPASQLPTAMLVPSKTIVRATALVPRTTVVRTKTMAPTMVTPVLSSNVILTPDESIPVYKEKHNGKLKQIGTLQPAVYY